MIEAHATAKGIRTSAQKAGLVCALIRGKDVNQALATLQFTRKTIARELAKVLRSAVATAQQELIQHYPRPGWVEHDPEEIWQAVLATTRQVVESGPARIAS